MEPVKPKTLRCAIYTRKSSEEGLDQDFNSLHAQREACESFIRRACEGIGLRRTDVFVGSRHRRDGFGWAVGWGKDGVRAAPC